MDREPTIYRDRCARRRAELDAALERVIAFARATPDVDRVVVVGSFARATPDVDRVVVVGSFARERVSPWSDLDLVVVRDGGPADLVDDLYRACGIPGDVISMRSTDWPRALEATPNGGRCSRTGGRYMHVPLDDRVRRWLD